MITIQQARAPLKIGTPVRDGVSGGLLFVDASGLLAQHTTNFQDLEWNNTSFKLVIGFPNTLGEGTLDVLTITAAGDTAVFRAKAAQTGDIIRCKNSGDVNIFRVSTTGHVVIGRTTADSLFNLIPANGRFNQVQAGDAFSRWEFNINIATTGQPGFAVGVGSATHETEGAVVARGSANRTLALYTSNGTAQVERLSIDGVGAVVINDGGLSTADVRIEGDTDANLVFTDASADKVGFGTATPDEKVTINGNLSLSPVSGYIYGFRRRVLSKTTNYSVSGDDSGTQLDNIGASAEVNFTLPDPTAFAGAQYGFTVKAAFNLRVTAPTGVTISIGTSTSATAGNIVASAAYASVFLMAISATEYVALSSTGSWTVT